ncbi:hypothetical protein [Sphingobacterium tabacisoli]|uniref:DUF4843 domain-containing protein n=1 Tax=Sphingobacterium tabacisoli TaxID=2044855 RepID=A0ABW5L9J9_9SPHI|nr:hypothetical protein [Sphingobacterium tabacisoli]
MNSNIKLVILALVLGLVSCSKEEVTILPDYDKNWLIVEEDPNDATTQARFAFFKETGVPIYINDTIGTQERIDVFGKAFTHYEVLSLNYSLSTPAVGASPLVMNVKYLDENNLPAALAFLKSEVIPLVPATVHIPSVLLVESFWSNAFGNYAFKGFNTVLIGEVSKIATMDSATKAKYKGAILRSIFTNAVLAEKYEATLEKFYNVSRRFVPTRDAYNIYIPQLPTFVAGLPAGVTATPQAIGFLGADGRNSYYTPMSTWMDVSLYLDAIFGSTPEQFSAQYGSYEAIMRKHDYIKQILTDLGVNL